MTTLALALDLIVGLTVLHTLVNALLLRRPPRDAHVAERVSILMPVRDEAGRIEASLRSVLAQQGLHARETIVYDDCSRDGTADVVRDVAGERARVVDGVPLPPGWLGKPHACARLAAEATGSVLVFVDADVMLAPDAVASAVTLLREHRLAFASPYPRQLAQSWLERLVQPLLQWSWLTFLPLRIAERTHRPSLAAANGQLLVVDAETYRRAGGHAAVRGEVVEDVALARALVRVGGHGGFVDGRDIASCRMYDGPGEVVGGYAKSLWHAFGSPAGAVVVSLLLLALGVLPWVLLVVTPWAWPAAVGGPVGRLVAAVRAGSRPALDAVLHPLSLLAFVALVGVSLRRRRRGALTWKSRQLA